MKKITLIGICLLMALIGVCVLTAGSLSNNTTNNSPTQSINDQQQNPIQDVIITKTAEVSKLVQKNPLAPKKENKTVTKNTKKMNSTTSKVKHTTNSTKTNKNNTQQKTITNNTTNKNQTLNSTTNKNNTTVKNQSVSQNSNSTKIQTNTTKNSKKSLNKTSKDMNSPSDSQMSRYIAYYQQHHDVNKLIALVSQDHTADETQKIVNQICGKY